MSTLLFSTINFVLKELLKFATSTFFQNSCFPKLNTTKHSLKCSSPLRSWCLNSFFLSKNDNSYFFFQFWRKLSLKTKGNLVLYKNLNLILSSNLKFSNLLSFSEALLWANPAACDHTVFCTRFVQFTLLMSQLVYMSMSWPSFILGGRSQTMLTRLCPLWTTYLPSFDIP